MLCRSDGRTLLSAEISIRYLTQKDIGMTCGEEKLGGGENVKGGREANVVVRT